MHELDIFCGLTELNFLLFKQSAAKQIFKLKIKLMLTCVPSILYHSNLSANENISRVYYCKLQKNLLMHNYH